MHFEYDETRPNEPVAYIDRDGDLVIRTENGAAAVCSDMMGNYVIDIAVWNQDDAEHLIYPGDTITVTF